MAKTRIESNEKLMKMKCLFIVLLALVSQALHAQKPSIDSVKVCGYYIQEFVKEEIREVYESYLNRKRGKSYKLIIDFSKRDHVVITKLNGEALVKDDVDVLEFNEYIRPCSEESDTILVFPENINASLFKMNGIGIKDLAKLDYTKSNALQFSPYYESKDKKKLFKCFYFEGKATIRDVSSLDSKYGEMFVSDFSIGKVSSKRHVMVIEDITYYTPYKLIGSHHVWLPQ